MNARYEEFCARCPRLARLLYLLLVVDNCSPDPVGDAVPTIIAMESHLDQMERDTACLGELTDTVDLGSPFAALAFGEETERETLLAAHPELKKTDEFLETIFGG